MRIGDIGGGGGEVALLHVTSWFYSWCIVIVIVRGGFINGHKEVVHIFLSDYINHKP